MNNSLIKDFLAIDITSMKKEFHKLSSIEVWLHEKFNPDIKNYNPHMLSMISKEISPDLNNVTEEQIIAQIELLESCLKKTRIEVIQFLYDIDYLNQIFRVIDDKNLHNEENLLKVLNVEDKKVFIQKIQEILYNIEILEHFLKVKDDEIELLTQNLIKQRNNDYINVQISFINNWFVYMHEIYGENVIM